METSSQPPTVSSSPRDDTGSEVLERLSVNTSPIPQPQQTSQRGSQISSPLTASTATTMTAVIDIYESDSQQDAFPAKVFDFNPRSLLSLPQQAIRSVGYLLVGFFLLANALNYTNGRMPDPERHPTLPDVGFDITPKYDIEHLTNVCVAILNVLNIFTVYKYILYYLGKPILPIFPARLLENPIGKFLLCPPQIDVHPQMFLEQFLRWSTTYATMLYVRCVVITVTVLPATDNHCKNPVPIEDWWHNVMLTMVTMGGGSIHCGDLLFSGHMTIITVSALSIMCYGGRICKLFPYAAALPYLASWFTIVSSRSHYTDDIVVATLFSGLFYAVIWMGGENPEPSKLQSVRGAPFCLQCIFSPLEAFRYFRNSAKSV